MVHNTGLSGHERILPNDELIVSKTDTKGRILYANDTFLAISGYNEAEVIGQPHNIIRHPAMPRAVFKLMWDTIEAGDEIFAYVVNRSKNGDHYWVLAHVTPNYDSSGAIIGYHSNRRAVPRAVIEPVEALYGRLRQEEARFDRGKEGMAAAARVLEQAIAARGCRTYEQFVLGLA